MLATIFAHTVSEIWPILTEGDWWKAPELRNHDQGDSGLLLSIIY